MQHIPGEDQERAGPDLRGSTGAGLAGHMHQQRYRDRIDREACPQYLDAAGRPGPVLRDLPRGLAGCRAAPQRWLRQLRSSRTLRVSEILDMYRSFLPANALTLPGKSLCGSKSRVHTGSVTIRGYQPRDLDDLYRICLLTADSGKDATALYRNPRLPGEIYAAPYGIFEPELAFVAEDSEGSGRLHTRRAGHDGVRRPAGARLVARAPGSLPGFVTSSGCRPLGPEQQALDNIHHPWRAREDLTARFPSHLHIDLLPRLQGRGLGRRLVDTFTAALRACRSRGLHLFVTRGNIRAIEFYRHVGMTELRSPTQWSSCGTSPRTAVPGRRRARAQDPR